MASWEDGCGGTRYGLCHMDHLLWPNNVDGCVCVCAPEFPRQLTLAHFCWCYVSFWFGDMYQCASRWPLCLLPSLTCMQVSGSVTAQHTWVMPEDPGLCSLGQVDLRLQNS
jgi:hypothetical protein